MPGYSLFYSSSTADATADIVTFFNSVKTLFPSGLQWSVPPAGDTLDDSTGALNGTWTGVGAGVVSASATGPYAAGTGAWIRWLTGTITGRRRLQGRTFMAPLTSAVGVDSSGTIATAALTTLGSAAANLAATGKLVIWHRPDSNGVGGSSALILAATVPDQVTSLRSRRY